MRFGRRSPFGELVDRQLALFAEDNAEVLAEATEAEAAWNAADRENAEEAYGDYQLVVDAVADALLDVRERYAATVTDPDGYRDEFNRAARRRFRRYTSLLADLDEA